jgi:Cu(I)/Ag(I) efflux system membrane protein CusA/SilA
LYGQPWFLDFELVGTPMRDLFQVGTVNMSVAVWVGFVALVGVATDDGVVMSTYLKQRFERDPPESVEEVRQRTLEAGSRRVRPCLMTTATTILALLPVITSQGRGSDIMVPMALPSAGGMAIELLTLFVVPVLYCAREERKLKAQRRRQPPPSLEDV